MLIPYISVFIPKPITSLTVGTLKAGIELRLPILTYLFCPDEEIDPQLVLKELRIEECEGDELKIWWRPRMRYPPRAYRFDDELQEQLKMARFGLSWYRREAVLEPTRILGSCTDGVGFAQGYTRDDMGWPVVMAAAATIVDQAGGAIVTNGYGWFVPSGNEVERLFDPQSDRV